LRETLFCTLGKWFREFIATMHHMIPRSAFRARQSREDQELWDPSVPPTLQRRVRQADWVRSRNPNARRIDRLIADLEGNATATEFMLMFERLTISSPYVVALVYDEPEATVVVTNWEVGPYAWPSRDAPLFRLRFPRADGAAFRHLQFTADVGGDPDVADGALEVLTMRAIPEEPRQGILYGIDLGQEPSSVEAILGGDGYARWETFNRFRMAMDELMSQRVPISVEQLPAGLRAT